jgi:preprotein translocase subunit SecG
MTVVLVVLHGIICILLIGLVMIQRGRGGGLVESFSGVESMFGTKTSTFLTKATTVLSVMFFLTCLSLALLSIRQSKSLIPVKQDAVEPKLPPAAEAPKASPIQENAPVPAQP